MTLKRLSLAAAFMLSVSPVGYAQDKEPNGASESEKSEVPEKKAADPGTGQQKQSPSTDKDNGSSARSDNPSSGKNTQKNASPENKKQNDSGDDDSKKVDKAADPRPKPDDNSPQVENKADTQPNKENSPARNATGEKKDEKAEPVRPANTDGKGGPPAESKTDSSVPNETVAPKSAPSPDQAAGGREKPEKVRSVEVSGDKRERVTTVFRNNTSVKRLTNVNVEISVGRRLPSDWEYYPVPITVIDLVPEYRGYRYVYVEDRYIIVEPDTYEVVYVFEATGGAAPRSATSGSAARNDCRTDISFSDEDRLFIKEKLIRTQSVQIGQLEIGLKLPESIQVETFPSEITTRVATLQGCRFIVVDERVVVVDPTEDKVVYIFQ